MTNAEIIGIVTQDLENKKVFVAEWDGRCDSCSVPILEGDEFVFMGSKRKVCQNCRAEIMDHLQSL